MLAFLKVLSVFEHMLGQGFRWRKNWNLGVRHLVERKTKKKQRERFMVGTVKHALIDSTFGSVGKYSN